MASVHVRANPAINGMVHPVSDRRLKDRIVPVTNALSAVTQPQGVSYEWKDKSGGRDGRQLGLFDQDVEKIVPDLVSTDKSKRHLKTLNYDGFSALFVESIKKLDRKIDLSAETQTTTGGDDIKLPDWLIGLLGLQSTAIVWLVLRPRRH